MRCRNCPRNCKVDKNRDSHCTFLAYGKVRLLDEAKSGYSPSKPEATLFRGPKKRMRVV